VDLILLLAALVGHAFLWVALVNRIHSTAMPPFASHLLTLTCFTCLVLIPVGTGWLLWAEGFDQAGRLQRPAVPGFAMPYLATCWIAAGLSVAWWLWRTAVQRRSGVLHAHRTRLVKLGSDASQEHAQHYLVRLPGNQILHLDLTERAIEVPRLPAALDGLSLVHVSDFHFTGRVAKAYFEEVVRRSNLVEPDLVAITGDLVDESRYIDWIPDTLGKLRARHGVYFVLGNHDLRINTDRLRKTLADCGLVDLGGRWVQREIRRQPLILAGNELPWIAPAADMADCPPRTPGGGPLRIVLSHSPDQLAWAQAHDADLLLAGHTHGGQIRLPLIGPIFAPSAEGVRYACGLFSAPPTIMHVTRGVSGELPVRLNCPPEMARLVLCAPQRPGVPGDAVSASAGLPSNSRQPLQEKP